MINVKTLAVAILLTTILLQPAFAYQTTVTTRSYASKLPTDDLIVVKTYNNTGKEPQWFRTEQMGNSFAIRLIDNSLAVMRNPLELPGLVQMAYVIESLDKLHDLRAGQEHGPTYDMRAFFNEDFMWIEVWPSDSKTAPVKSTYQLTGSDRETYEFYMRHHINGTGYANQKELVDDIQKNYADKYNPDFINLINFPQRGRNAVISSMLRSNY